MSNHNESLIKMIFQEITERLNKQNEELTAYMNQYFTQEERNSHGDNLCSCLARPEGLIAKIQLQTMAMGIEIEKN